MVSKPYRCQARFGKVTTIKCATDNLVGPLTLYWSICHKAPGDTSGKYTVLAENKEVIRSLHCYQFGKSKYFIRVIHVMQKLTLV